jgi:hypothetical protein
MEQPKDTFATRVVVIALAIVVVGGLGSIVFLASTQTTIPDALDRLVFSALGAISALLAKTAVSIIPGPTQVEVTNTAEAPVPVTEDPANPETPI